MILSSDFGIESLFRKTVNQGNLQNHLGENLLCILGGSMNYENSSHSSSVSISESFASICYFGEGVQGF